MSWQGFSRGFAFLICSWVSGGMRPGIGGPPVQKSPDEGPKDAGPWGRYWTVSGNKKPAVYMRSAGSLMSLNI